MSVKPNLEPIIIEVVNANAGIRNVYLVLKVMQSIGPVMFNVDDYDTAIQDLLTRGDIIELEVVMPQADYRVKSIYFPKGTRFLNVKEAGKQITITYAESTVSNNDQSASDGE